MGNDPSRATPRCSDVAPIVFVQAARRSSAQCAGVCAEKASQCVSRGHDICVGAHVQLLKYGNLSFTDDADDLNPYLLGFDQNFESIALPDDPKPSDVIDIEHDPIVDHAELEPDSEPGSWVIDLDEHIRSGEPLSYSPRSTEYKHRRIEVLCAEPNQPISTNIESPGQTPDFPASAASMHDSPRECLGHDVALRPAFPAPAFSLERSNGIEGHDEWVARLYEHLAEPCCFGRARNRQGLHTTPEKSNEPRADCDEACSPNQPCAPIVEDGQQLDVNHVAQESSLGTDTSRQQQSAAEPLPAAQGALLEVPSFSFGDVVEEPPLLGPRRLRFEGGARDRFSKRGRRAFGIGFGGLSSTGTNGPSVPRVRVGVARPSHGMSVSPQQVQQPGAAEHQAPDFRWAEKDFNSIATMSSAINSSPPRRLEQLHVASGDRSASVPRINAGHSACVFLQQSQLGAQVEPAPLSPAVWKETKARCDQVATSNDTHNAKTVQLIHSTPTSPALSAAGVDSLRAVVLAGFTCADLNVVFVERASEDFRVVGRASYWSPSKQHFLYYCSHTHSWTIEKAKRFKKVRGGQVGGIVKGPYKIVDIASAALRVGTTATPQSSTTHEIGNVGTEAVCWQEWCPHERCWVARPTAGVIKLGKVRPSNSVASSVAPSVATDSKDVAVEVHSVGDESISSTMRN